MVTVTTTTTLTIPVDLVASTLASVTSTNIYQPNGKYYPFSGIISNATNPVTFTFVGQPNVTGNFQKKIVSYTVTKSEVASFYNNYATSSINSSQVVNVQFLPTDPTFVEIITT